MTLSAKQVGSALFVALGLAVYVGCSAPPSTSEGERVGATGEALLGPQACVDVVYNTTPWSLDSTCSCAKGTTGAALDQCAYEMLLVTCLKNQGFVPNCAALPPLTIVSVNDWGKFSAYYEDMDFNVFFPKDCRRQAAMATCVKGVNAGKAPDGTLFVDPPVSAALLNRCDRAKDYCVGQGFPTHADFDPCTTKNCAQ